MTIWFEYLNILIIEICKKRKHVQLKWRLDVRFFFFFKEKRPQNYKKKYSMMKIHLNTHNRTLNLFKSLLGFIIFHIEPNSWFS